MAEGLLALYEATADERWFTEAVSLAEVMLSRFADPAGGFFDTADDAERLVVRPRDVQDNAVPSGGAVAATVLLRLTALTGEPRYRAAAERAIATVGPLLRTPSHRVRAVAHRPRAGPRRDHGGRDHRRPGDPRHRGTGPLREPGLYAVPGAGRYRLAHCVRRAAAAPPVRSARPADGIRLQGLLVPTAGARARGAGRPSRRDVTGIVQAARRASATLPAHRMRGCDQSTRKDGRTPVIVVCADCAGCPGLPAQGHTGKAGRHGRSPTQVWVIKAEVKRDSGPEPPGFDRRAQRGHPRDDTCSSRRAISMIPRHEQRRRHTGLAPVTAPRQCETRSGRPTAPRGQGRRPGRRSRPDRTKPRPSPLSALRVRRAWCPHRPGWQRRP